MKYVPPSVEETAFNCPHCGALTTQYWHSIRAKANTEQSPMPLIISQDDDRDFREIPDKEARETTVALFKRLKMGLPVFEESEESLYNATHVYNLNLSECYNCKKLAVWIYSKLIYPECGKAPPANPDLPDDIRRDYDEANAILDLSPRGAAALIRLCIQKLCEHLGQPGKNINDDIASLVKSGLDNRIQKALDAVRVIGNNAVHPGQIDLTDDRATAETLFRLLNLIAEKVISEPKHVDEVYDKLPATAKAAIAARDGKKTSITP